MSKIGVWKPDQEVRTKAKDLSLNKAKEIKKSAEQCFWDNCISEKRDITFCFKDSSTVAGRLLAYDNYFLLIEANGKQRLLQKGGLLWAE